MKKNSQLTERIKAVIASKPSSSEEMKHLAYELGYKSLVTLYSRLENGEWTKPEMYWLESVYCAGVGEEKTVSLDC